MMKNVFFLHGLDSSGKGTKGSYLTGKFPQVNCPDFSGSLQQRLEQLVRLCLGKTELTLIGSSYGGLMATCFAIKYPQQVARLALLAPALNFEDFQPPEKMLEIVTMLVIGKADVVTPPELVLPLAEQTFSNLDVILADDDHFLHNTFRDLDWSLILTGTDT